MRALVLVVLAVACSKPEDTDIVDTDVEDTDVDVPETLHGYVIEPIDVLSDGHFRAGLVQVGLADLSLGAEFLTSEVGGNLFAMPLPLEGPGGELGDPWGTHPGLEAAVYVPMMYEDLDLSATYSAEDGIIGVNDGRWLAWIGGTIPSGWPSGWTLLSVDPSDPVGDPETFVPVTEEVQVTMRGTVSESRLWGNMESPTDESRRLGAFDVRWFTEGEYVEPLAVNAKIEADGHFEERVYRRPGTDQFFKDSPTDLWYARAVPVAYLDMDDDNDFSEDADVVTSAGACTADGKPVWLRYVFQPTTLAQALELEKNGWTSGWRAVVSDGLGGEEDIGLADSKNLTVSESCAPTWVD